MQSGSSEAERSGAIPFLATVGMHLCFDAGTRGEDVAAEAVNSWNSDGVYVNSILVAGRDSGRAIASGSVTYRIVKRPRRK